MRDAEPESLGVASCLNRLLGCSSDSRTASAAGCRGSIVNRQDSSCLRHKGKDPDGHCGLLCAAQRNIDWRCCILCQLSILQAITG
jgi:hypothetical protein